MSSGQWQVGDLRLIQLDCSTNAIAIAQFPVVSSTRIPEVAHTRKLQLYQSLMLISTHGLSPTSAHIIHCGQAALRESRVPQQDLRALPRFGQH